MKNTSNLKRKSSILLRVKGRESTRQSFPTKEWQKKYPWVTCKDPSNGMFCETRLKWGNAPAGSRGAWKTRGITDWNHGTELLEQHADSQWQRDAAATAVMQGRRRVGSRNLSSNVQVLHNRLLNVGREIEMFYLKAVEISILSCQE